MSKNKSHLNQNRLQKWAKLDYLLNQKCLEFAYASRKTLGSEINVQYTKKFAGKYNFGIKYGTYDAGDIKVDTNRFWMWIGTRF